MFYYHHPQNRFWKVIANILAAEVPETIADKKKMLLSGRIAIWDVMHSCTITGSSESSIKDVIVNDFTKLLETADIRQIYGNGGKAYELYQKYSVDKTGRQMIKLPSTSPANAAWSLERLAEAWSICLKDLD